MASLVILSSSKKPSLPVSAYTSSVRCHKYYVVSVGKRTGVFDNWFVHLLVFRIAVIYSFLSCQSRESVHDVLVTFCLRFS